jgi:tyrosine-protein kinase Etk/Wzc
MMQDPNFPEFFMPQEEPVHIKEFLMRTAYYWKWFAVSLFIGVGAATLYNRFAAPEYEINATVLVEDEKKGMEMSSLFEGLNMGGTVKIQNHIGLLQSYSLNYKTLENLGWKVSWFEDTPFYEKDLYGSEPPYLVTSSGTKANPTGIPIHITRVSEIEYLVEADGKKPDINGQELEVKLNAKGTFGRPFENGPFSFTIEKNNASKGNTSVAYFFSFNDIEQLALAYKRKLVVNLVDKQSDLISLQLKGVNPVREMDYLNELGRVYIKYGLTEKNRTSENTLRFIDSQLLGITDSLYRAENNFTSFRSEKKVVDLTQEAGLVLTKVEELESQKAMADMRLAYVSRLKKEMKDSRQMKQMVTPSVVGFTDETFNALVTKLIDLYSKREVLAFSLEERAPSIQLLDKELKMTLDAVAKTVDNLQSNLQIEGQNLDKRIAQLGGQLSNLPQNEQKLLNLKRRFDLNNDLYTFLLKKRAETAITMAASVPDVKVVDPARRITTIKTGPKKMLNYLIGLILGLFTPLIILIIYDNLNDSIQTKEEVEQRTKLPIIGTVAHNDYDKEMIVTEHPRSSIAESFRSLRTNLKYIIPGEDQKVIALHSTIPGEGKTFVSLNLALILALNNNKVLLVGVDMRKPMLHNRFQSDNKKGLSTYLINLNTFDEVVEKTDVENLSFTPSGPIPPNPAELLENEYFGLFLAEAKKRFDYIVLDNAPISMVTDGILVGAHADVNLILLRLKYSHRNQVKFIDDLAERKALPNLGIVLNDARMDGYGYTGRYNSYNGYGHGYYDDSPNLGRIARWTHKAANYVKRQLNML